MKTLFIIPGFMQSTTDEQYQWMIKHFTQHGFHVKEVPITWKHKVMSDYVEEFKSYYRRHASTENYVLGFSFGGMIAYISAPELKPDKLILCSLSAYFQEDLSHIKPSYKRSIGKRRVQDFESYEAAKTAPKIASETVVIYGSREGKEYPRHKYRNEWAGKNIKNAHLYIAENAPHRLDFPSYIETIKRGVT